MRAELGVGLPKVLSFGGGGKGKLLTTMHYYKKRIEYMKMVGSLDVYVKLKLVLATFEKSWNWLESTWYEDGAPSSDVMPLALHDGIDSEAGGKPDLFDMSQYTIDDIGYLASGSPFMGGISAFSARKLNNEAPFVANAYEGADPQTAFFSDGTRIAIWIGYNEAYAGADGLNLFYSYYNGSWSLPQVVESDGTTDAYPDLKIINDVAYLVWQDASGSVSGMETLDEIAGLMDISGAVFDPVTGCFTTYSVIENSGVLNMQPKLCGEGNNVYVVWHRNGENDWFGQNYANSLLYSSFDGHSWNSASTLYSGLGPLMDFDVTYSDEIRVAYSLDGDGNLSTQEDVEIYVNGCAQTSNEYLDSGVTYKGTDLYWYSGGKLLCNGYDTMAEGVFIGSDRFQILDENGVHAVVYAEEDGLASVLYAAYYDSASGLWGNPIVLYSNGTSISSFSASVKPEGEISVLLQNQDVVGDFNSSDPYGTVNLAWYNAPLGCNIRLDDIRYNNENYVLNKDMPVYITVSNTGELPVQQLLVEWIDENGAILQKRTVSQQLLSGETKEIKVLYRIVEVVQGKKLTVRITPVGKDETNVDDNTAVMEMRWNDLSVENINYGTLEDGSIVIHANIVNRGYEQQKDITVKLIQGSASGKVVDTATLDSLEAFALKNVAFTITNTPQSVYYVALTHKETDCDYSNDSDFVKIEELICTHDAVIIPAVEPTCTENGLTEGKCCSICEEVLAVQQIVPAKGHTEVVDKAKDATCTETGLTEGKHCSVCNQILLEQEVTPPSEHIVVEGICTGCGMVGDCGTNLTWSLDSNGTLTISGAGEMDGYCEGTWAPWYRYRNKIHKIVIEDGITMIGAYAFYECSNLTDIYITDIAAWLNIDMSSYSSNPLNVNGLEKKLYLNGTLLENLEVPEGIKAIRDHVFANCRDLKSVKIPSAVTSIGKYAFYNCRSLTDIYYGGTADQWASLGCSVSDNQYVHYECASSDGHWEVYSQDATCEDAGYTADRCGCGYERNKKNTDAAIGHNMGKWVSNGNGQERRDCSRCDHYETRAAAVTVKAPVIKASGVTATGKIKISWSKVTGAAKYEIYRATSKTGTYSSIGTATGTSYTDKSAAAGKTYYYKVKALDSKGKASAFSNIVSRTCDLAQPVVKAANVSSSGKIKLSWKEIDGAKEYKIYRATSKSGEYKLLKTTDSTSYTTGGTVGKTYYYKVKAIHKNADANSAYSEIVSCILALARPDVSIKLKNGDPKLNWGKISGATKYYVYRATSKDGKYTKLTTTTSSSYTDKSAKAGKTYYYKVMAVHKNSSANSAYSSVDKIKAK